MRAVAAIALVIGLTPADAGADPKLDALVAAYPDHLASHDGSALVWKDGTRMPVSDGRTGKRFRDLLDAPDIKDQFAIPYPLGGPLRAPGRNEDPGRIRNEAFFTKMYGDCRRGEVSKTLKRISWLAGRGGGALLATTINGVADRLEAVSRELDKLPARMTPYLVPSAGTYHCRAIAGTNRLSVHAYGAAIDLASKFGDYWRWSAGKNVSEETAQVRYTNRVPVEIVEIFERHGFIWGGKWYHYDTFHFEYRPEIIALARQGWPQD